MSLPNDGVKNGGTMFSSEISGSDTSERHSEDRGTEPNFRAFAIDSSGNPVYGDPLEVTEGSAYISFVLHSIMSNFFQKKDSLEYIMREVYAQYPASRNLTIHVCGDGVYRTTQSTLFSGSQTRDPITRGAESWKEKYDQVVQNFADSGLSTDQSAVYWDQVKTHSNYLPIKKFTDVVFKSDLNLEGDLKSGVFPDVQNSVLVELLSDITSLSISQKVLGIAEGFKTKNKTKADKRAKQAKGAAKKINELATQLGIDRKHDHICDEGVTWFNQLLAATREYLSEEFAVFMVLSLFENAASVKAVLGVDRLGLPPETRMTPVLNYPISRTKGSDAIFIAYRLVEGLYIKYCGPLNLPVIAKPAVLVDIFMPDVYPSYGLDLPDGKPAAKDKQDELLRVKEPDSSTSVVSSGHAFFTPAPDSNADEATARKIIHLINSHINSTAVGLHTATNIKYKNGVECDIVVSKLESAPSEQIDNRVRNAQEERIKQLIIDGIEFVRDGTTELVITIEYIGFSIKLTMSSVQPSASFKEAKAMSSSPSKWS